MKSTIGSPPRPAGEFDVPLAQVADEMRALKDKAAREEAAQEQSEQEAVDASVAKLRHTLARPVGGES